MIIKQKKTMQWKENKVKRMLVQRETHRKVSIERNYLTTFFFVFKGTRLAGGKIKNFPGTNPLPESKAYMRLVYAILRVHIVE